MCKKINTTYGCGHSLIKEVRCPSRGTYTSIIPQRCLRQLATKGGEQAHGCGNCLVCLLDHEWDKLPKGQMERAQAGGKGAKKKGKGRKQKPWLAEKPEEQPSMRRLPVKTCRLAARFGTVSRD